MCLVGLGFVADWLIDLRLGCYGCVSLCLLVFVCLFLFGLAYVLCLSNWVAWLCLCLLRLLMVVGFVPLFCVLWCLLVFVSFADLSLV